MPKDYGLLYCPIHVVDLRVQTLSSFQEKKEDKEEWFHSIPVVKRNFQKLTYIDFFFIYIIINTTTKTAHYKY